MPGAPAHHRERGFANLDPTFTRPGFWTVQAFRLRRVWSWLTGERPAPAVRVVANDGRALGANDGAATVTWVGHATLLVQLDGVNVLTDPHWSARASPFPFAGPRRLYPPGLAFEDLPPIHAVVISHDHYDSLDVATVRRLAAAHRPRFLVPLGFRAWFAGVGIGEGVEELDWWERREVRGVTFTFVPTQHWSARTPWDADRRLWGGWALAGRERRALFVGDTGWWAGLREIGARLGPFDLVMVGIGAYEPPAVMARVHTTPEEALRVFGAVRGRTFVAMHWGTFDLGEEPLDEPPRRLEAEARRLGLPPERVWVLGLGETRRW